MVLWNSWVDRVQSTGSTGALALRSLRTGSTRPTYQQQQEDFIANVVRAHGKIPVSQSPSVVTRVWFPPIDEWFCCHQLP